MNRIILMCLMTMVAAVFLATGCAAVLVGGGLYKSSKTKEQRQAFITELQKTNTEREIKGLPHLEWCSEAYKFDEGYANNDKQCAERIRAYKKGDTTALNLGGSITQQTPVPVSETQSTKPSKK